MKLKFYIIGILFVLFLGLVLYFVSRGSDTTIDERVIEEPHKDYITSSQTYEVNETYLQSNYNSTQSYSNITQAFNQFGSLFFVLFALIPIGFIIFNVINVLNK